MGSQVLGSQYLLDGTQDSDVIPKWHLRIENEKIGLFGGGGHHALLWRCPGRVVGRQPWTPAPSEHQRCWLCPRSNKDIGTYSKSSKQSEGFLQGILSHK